jgi:hypothetical protein
MRDASPRDERWRWPADRPTQHRPAALAIARCMPPIAADDPCNRA